MVQKPQINLQYQAKKTQMLIASKKSCMITYIESTLPYDNFHQDTKIQLKVVFTNFECFFPSVIVDKNNNNPLWLDNYLWSDKQTRDWTFVTKSTREVPCFHDFCKVDVLNRVIYCDQATFENTWYTNNMCELDFES